MKESEEVGRFFVVMGLGYHAHTTYITTTYRSASMALTRFTRQASREPGRECQPTIYLCLEVDWIKSFHPSTYPSPPSCSPLNSPAAPRPAPPGGRAASRRATPPRRGAATTTQKMADRPVVGGA